MRGYDEIVDGESIRFRATIGKAGLHALNPELLELLEVSADDNMNKEKSTIWNLYFKFPPTGMAEGNEGMPINLLMPGTSCMPQVRCIWKLINEDDEYVLIESDNTIYSDPLGGYYNWSPLKPCSFMAHALGFRKNNGDFDPAMSINSTRIGVHNFTDLYLLDHESIKGKRIEFYSISISFYAKVHPGRV